MPTDTVSPSSSLAARIGPLADLDCIAMCLDNRGQITFLNPSGLRFFGYKEPEILGSPAVGTLFPDDACCNLPPLNRIDSSTDISGNDGHHRCRCRRKNGELVWVVWSSQTLSDANGNVREHLFMGHDITGPMTHLTQLEMEMAHLTDTIQRHQDHLQKLADRLEDQKKAH